MVGILKEYFSYIVLYIKNYLYFYFNFLNMYFYDNWEGYFLIIVLKSEFEIRYLCGV